MLTHASPKMRLLLIKSDGQFKHSGKYYLLNGRWHKLQQDKPAPKGAPIASVPHAAGQHLPATLTSEEVEALKYPAKKAAANNEMAAFNDKHLPELLSHAANGDATAILGMGYGSNTHGKKKALIANHLLGKMGSKHTVTPGQKPGAHAAVQAAPEIQAGEPAPVKEDGDWLTQLFGNQTGGPKNEPASDVEPVKVDPAVVVSAIASAMQSAEATIQKWQAKDYKPNKTQVDLHGDGPSNQSSMSIGAINESKKKKAIAASAQEVEALKKLQNQISTPEGLKQVSNLIASTMNEAKSEIANQTAIPSMKTAGDLFEYLILQKLGVKSAYGAITSNGVSKALRAVAEGKPAPVEPVAAIESAATSSTPHVAIAQHLIENLTLPPHVSKPIAWTGSKTKNAALAVNFLVSLGQKVTTQSSAKGSALALYSPTNGFFVDASNKFWAEPVANQKAQFDAGFLSSPNPMHTMLHEIGHAQFSASDNWMGGGSHKEIAKTLSKYAGMNPKEFCAEFFAAHAAGMEITPDQIKLFNIYAKPNKTLFQKEQSVPHGESMAAEASDVAPVAENSPSAATGPKDGDTKQGADGMLVFKDGRWHKQVSADLPGAGTVTAPAASTGQPQALSMPAFQEGKTVAGVVEYYQKVGQKVLDLAAAGDVAGLKALPTNKGKTWQGKTPNSKMLLALHAQALLHAGKAAAVQHLKGDKGQSALPAADSGQNELKPEKVMASAAKALLGSIANGDDHSVSEIESALMSGYKQKFVLKNSSGEVVGAAAFGLNDAGPSSSVELHHVGSIVPGGGTALVIEAVKFAESKGVPLTLFSHPSAVGFYEKLGFSQIQGKPAGLLKFSGAQVVKKKDEALQAAVDHLKEDAKQGDLPAAEKKEDAALVRKLEAAQAPAKKGDVFELDSQYEKMNAGKWTVYNVSPDGALIYMHKVGAKVPNQSNSATIPASTLKEAIEKGTAKKLEAPRLVLPKKAPDQNPIKNAEPAAATVSAAPAPSGGKLDQIPWDSLKLPDTNSNAKQHNGALDKIKALAMAGDVAGLEALHAKKKDSKQTYIKKQALLAQTALAALKEGGAPAAAAESSTAPAAPPSLASKPAYDHISQQLKDGGFADTAAKDWMAANPGAWDELNEALTAHGYEHLAKFGPVASINPMAKQGFDQLAKLAADDPESFEALKKTLDFNQPGSPNYEYAKKKIAEIEAAKAADTGPKEGDTKQGADGLLVFKDGRWHKVDDDADTAGEHAAAGDAGAQKSLAWSVFHNTTAGHNKFWAVTVDGNKLVTHYGKIGAQGTTTVKEYPSEGAALNAGTKLAVSKTNGGYVFNGHEHYPVPDGAKPAPKPASATVTTKPALESMDAWTQTGPQGGSNPGGRFKDQDGVEWYCKFPADEDAAKAEVLAAKLYAALGIAGQDAKLITNDGKVGIASKWTTVSKASSPAALAKVDGVAAGFGADAWLANWDVVGLGYDNLQIGADGKAHRVDAGGSLMYRAQGGKKAFGNVVTEIDSLRDPKINPQAAKVFGGMTEADITASVARVLALSDAQINTMVMMYGPGDEDAKKALAATLIARKQDLANKFPKAVKAKPAKPQFNPSNLTLPPNFKNWNNSGNGLSSKEFINESNQAAVDAVYAAAKEGNLGAIKNVQAPVFNKETGQVSSHVPLAQHPSQHVKAYWSDMVEEVDLQLNPPRPPEIGEIVLSSDLNEISAILHPVPSGDPVATVKKHKKIGNYILLGKVANVAPVVPKETDAVIGSDVWKQKAKDSYHSASSDAKGAFSLYVTTSGAKALNTALRTGNTKAVVSGKTVEQHVKDFKGLLVDIPEGSTFVRRMGMKGYGQTPNEKAIKQLQQFLMTAESGTVLQEPGFSSTSWSGGNKILGNNDIEWEFVAAKGVKMFPGWLSANSGEGEGLLPPNQRYMIVSSKKEGKTVRVKAILLPTIE